MTKCIKKLTFPKLAFILAFFGVLILPLSQLLLYSGKVDIAGFLSGDLFVSAFINSILSAAVATLVSVSLAFVLARSVARSNIRFKGLWNVLFILPMLIPSISHGTGLIVLLGKNGILTNMFGLSFDIYGLLGIVVGSVMYSFPVAYIMIYDCLKYEDSTPYEAANVLGIGKFRQFIKISVPYIRKPMIAVIFSVFTLVITDYGVPLIVGGNFKTLPVMMYEDVIGLLDFGKGSVIGIVLLFPAVIAFILDIVNRDRGSQSFVSKPFENKTSKIKKAFSYLLCGTVSLVVILPILAFVLLTFMKKYPIDMTVTFANIEKAINMNMLTYLMNSLIIAFFVSVIGVITAYAISYLTARTKSKLSKLLHLMSIVTLAVPGLVLGISYVMFFNGSIIYGTLSILILVNMMHFFSSPYLMMYNTFGKLNGNLESVGETMGISRWRIVKDVLIPQSKSTIAEMFSYFFVNSMMTISAVSFLANGQTKPLSLLITSLEAQMLIECIAFVSLVILGVNLILKTVIYIYKKNIAKRETI